MDNLSIGITLMLVGLALFLAWAWFQMRDGQ